jgi:hypothetical protein
MLELQMHIFPVLDFTDYKILVHLHWIGDKDHIYHFLLNCIFIVFLLKVLYPVWWWLHMYKQNM